ncbi:hypothetical protein ACO2KH_13080 [Leptospira terpstrae]|uniref:hypothetical protein n=1 Tax=Leptospira terpstrae TaxID=293075 RepID=UPI003D06F001
MISTYEVIENFCISNNKNFSLQINSNEIDSIQRYLPNHSKYSSAEFAKDLIQLSNVFGIVT